MKQSKHRTAKLVRDYLIIFVIGAVLLYPIIWMFFASLSPMTRSLVPSVYCLRISALNILLMAGRAVVRQLTPISLSTPFYW